MSRLALTRRQPGARQPDFGPGAHACVRASSRCRM
jgi:hypothetical protein